MKKTLTALFALLTLTAPAMAKDTLTVYTYDSFVAEWGPGPKVKEAFEKTCDCTIEWVAPGDAVAMLNRLKLEGKSTKADVVLGLDTNLTAEAVKTGLFAKHGLDVTEAKTPMPWADEYFMPFDYGYFAVVYDSQAMKDPPKSLDTKSVAVLVRSVIRSMTSPGIMRTVTKTMRLAKNRVGISARTRRTM